jgi:thiamine kinase-like enzyme
MTQPLQAGVSPAREQSGAWAQEFDESAGADAGFNEPAQGLVGAARDSDTARRADEVLADGRPIEPANFWHASLQTSHPRTNGSAGGCSAADHSTKGGHVTAEDRIRALPCWSGGVEIAPLPGGLSNANYVVTDAAGKHVVRFGKDYPFHHVFRDREVMTARAAHAAGFAPAVIHAEPGILVTQFLSAKTFVAEDVRANLSRIAALMRGFHREMPSHVSGAGFMFWVFHVIRDYARTLEEGGSRKRGELPRLLNLADELERAQKLLPIVFGHNDLLPANILDDGSRLWLIDFEYAGFNTAMFDLAGVASNAGMSDEESLAFLTAYFMREPDEAIRRSHAAMQCASLLREAMWSMVSELYLDAPGIDYVAYTEENLTRLDTALDNYRTKYGGRS